MACPRQEREKLEHWIVGPYGVLAENTRGRLVPETECEIRTCFQRDIDRITHSKSFRRLKHKTQVFLQPEGDHYRTRLTHTLEVSRLSRTVARALALNEDLAEAIALGHDLGHTPFGHAGERAPSASATGSPTSTTTWTTPSARASSATRTCRSASGPSAGSATARASIP